MKNILIIILLALTACSKDNVTPKLSYIDLTNTSWYIETSLNKRTWTFNKDIGKEITIDKSNTSIFTQYFNFNVVAPYSLYITYLSPVNRLYLTYFIKEDSLFFSNESNQFIGTRQ